MKHNLDYLKFDGNIIFMFLFIVAFSISMYSCKSLQKTKGYENYQQNTDWKIRKL